MHDQTRLKPRYVACFILFFTLSKRYTKNHIRNIPADYRHTTPYMCGVLEDFVKKVETLLTLTFCSWVNRNKVTPNKDRICNFVNACPLPKSPPPPKVRLTKFVLPATPSCRLPKTNSPYEISPFIRITISLVFHVTWNHHK